MNRAEFARPNPSIVDRQTYSPSFARSSSLSPVRMSPYYSLYSKPDYSLKSTFISRPHLDSTRYSFYDQPQMTTRQKEISDWSYGWRPSLSSNSSSHDVEQSSHPYRKSSPNRAAANDLKRKMVFALHDEIRLSPTVTSLEEISDIDRITDICRTTLKAMMESKKYRKYVHHMTNNVLT